MDKITFDKIEIGDVLYFDATKSKIYFFIFDRTPQKIFFTVYEFKGGNVTFLRTEKNKDDYKKSQISKANSHVPKGELLTQLLACKDIMDITPKI